MNKLFIMFLVLGISSSCTQLSQEQFKHNSNNASCSNMFNNYKISDIQLFSSKLEKLNLKKDDFETEEAYQQRLKNELNKQGINLDSTYYFSTKLDPEYVKYNADTQLLTIEEYAISNNSPDPFYLFGGYDSSLTKAGIKIDYGLMNIQLTLNTKYKNVGGYVGQNAFGVKAYVSNNSNHFFGIFDRKAAYGEGVFGNDKTAFSLTAPPEKAKKIKYTGIAVIAVNLKFPYFASGKKEYDATISSPLNNVYHFKYIIGNMNCAAIIIQSDGVVSISDLKT